jgi:hypothetical protein
MPDKCDERAWWTIATLHGQKMGAWGTGRLEFGRSQAPQPYSYKTLFQRSGILNKIFNAFLSPSKQILR